ncbi:MAG: aminopeptidase P family protein [Bacteroidetes bacterium]|nr:aminopeptidase P family protein [Bacteroidota bacterium]
MGFSGLPEWIYRDRVLHVQNELNERNLDALFVFSDEYRPGYTFYFADYFPVNVIEESPQGVYIPKEGEVVLFLGGINAKVAEDISWISDIRSVETLADFFQEEKSRIGRKVRTGLVGEAILPMKYGKRLEPLIESNDFIKSDDIVNKMRLIKSPEEIRLMEAVGELADIALRVAVKRLNEGPVTETELAAVAEYEIRKVGGVIGSATILAAGINTMKPTWRPSTKEILSGEPVLIDVNPLLRGYCADTAITVFCGEIPDEAKTVYEVGKQILHGVIKHIQPGEPASTIYDYFLRETTKFGYRDEFMKYAKGMRAVGHGVGLDVVEWPNLDKYSSFLLEPGMVLGVKFDLHGFAFGGLRNEVEVLVEDNGCRSLNQIIYDTL